MFSAFLIPSLDHLFLSGQMNDHIVGEIRICFLQSMSGYKFCMFSNSEVFTEMERLLTTEEIDIDYSMKHAHRRVLELVYSSGEQYYRFGEIVVFNDAIGVAKNVLRVERSVGMEIGWRAMKPQRVGIVQGCRVDNAPGGLKNKMLAVDTSLVVRNKKYTFLAVDGDRVFMVKGSGVQRKHWILGRVIMSIDRVQAIF